MEVLEVRYNPYSLHWVVEFRQNGEIWRVAWIHCRGFQDVWWKLFRDGESTYRASGVINIPHRRMTRIYPRTNEQALKFFHEIVLPHIRTKYPRF